MNFSLPQYVQNLAHHWLTRHIGYWTFIVVFFGLFWGSDEGYYTHFLLSELILLPVKMIGVYWILLIQVPKYLFTRKYIHFSIATLIIIVLVSITLRTLAFYILIPYYGLYNAKENLWNIYRMVMK